jgi:hypothetical protein
MESMDFLRGLSQLRLEFELIGYMNTADNQHIAVVLFNLSPRLRNQAPFAGGDFARFQRAAKSAG